MELECHHEPLGSGVRKRKQMRPSGLHDYKFWPHVGCVDNVFGDRNPVCSCVEMDAYQS
jgi:hypothetical protein